jgi:Tfp pilus assembly major pilin PilA
MKTRLSKQAFTLPEVLITAGIMLIMMIPISRIAYSTVLQTRYARDVGSAISAGQEQLEDFSNTLYDSITPGSDTNGDMNLSWTVTEQNSAKIVTVIVSWVTLHKTLNINLNAVYVEDIDGGFSF